MTKRPAFQFYPGDWLRDTGLRSCSAAARGLWMDILCFMHEGSPYGYLKVNHKVILAPNLARMCGLTLQETEGCLAELAEAGVFETDEEGVIFSRRMIRDEELRNKRAACGHLGGNPTLKDNPKVGVCLSTEVKQKPTPSSSSSSSSSNTSSNEEVGVEFPANLQSADFGAAWESYLAYRKSSRLKALAPASVQAQLRNLSEMGHDEAIEAINQSIANGWQGIFPPKNKKPAPAKQEEVEQW
jgi:hypothetical protein